ncbi:MAG: hydantoinase B/oxoprolinase family protein [Chloroflexi bacterium]|nr:hydantoinase B/oxoprolinase family protein [Chloroflexota bacterium]
MTDAFTTEVIRSGLVAITSEMKTNLMRTAYNMIIYEAEDFTVGLYDDEGNTLSIGLGLPTFIRGLSDTIKEKLAHWGRDEIEPGDMLLTNVSEVHGSHLNHFVFTMPVFNDAELMGFSSSMAHWIDVGGTPNYGGAVTRDIWSEGLQVPFVKIFRRGVQNQEITAIIRANCRNQELAMGDFRAQVAAVRTGERRLSALLARYGNEAFREAVRMIFAQSEAHARSVVRSIPDGEYEAESFMDDDGVALGQHIPVKVRVVVSGDQMTIDLSGVGPQVQGYFNSGPTAGRSAAQVAFKAITTPLLLPINDGAIRPLNIVLPPGTIVSATREAAKRWWMTVPMTVIDTIFEALAPACPELVPAAHHGDLNLAGGGFGAVWNADGQSATVCINDGDTHNHPVEAMEAKSSDIFIQRALRPDSGGPGRWRGGLGVIEQVEVTKSEMFSSKLERTLCPPWGLFGGGSAAANRMSIVRQDGTVERFPTGKIPPTRLQPGDGTLTEMGGGGGFGSPFDRPVESVLADVRAGIVSVACASSEYGVVVRQNGRLFTVDEAATLSCRSGRRQACPERSRRDAGSPDSPV